MSTDVAVQAKPLPLAERKKNIETKLQAVELELQGLCKDVKDADLSTTIASFKSKWKIMQDARKDFTGYVDSVLIAPFIAIEKRVDPETYEPYRKLVKRELDARIAKANADTAAKALVKEKAEFKEHVSNEFHRVFNERKVKMLYEIQNAIKLGIPVTEPLLEETIREIAAAKKEYVKYQGKVIQDADRIAIAKTIPQPNWEALVLDMLAEAIRLEEIAKSTLSSTDSNDGGVEQIIASQIEAAHEAHAEEKEQNKLVAAQEIVEVKTKDKVAVKVQREIEVENTKAWAEAVIAAFYENETAWLMLKNRSFDKVTIGHMAEALAKCPDITVEGVKYKEVKK